MLSSIDVATLEIIDRIYSVEVLGSADMARLTETQLLGADFLDGEWKWD